jgi:hypothetical protein
MRCLRHCVYAVPPPPPAAAAAALAAVAAAATTAAAAAAAALTVAAAAAQRQCTAGDIKATVFSVVGVHYCALLLRMLFQGEL